LQYPASSSRSFATKSAFVVHQRLYLPLKFDPTFLAIVFDILVRLIAGPDNDAAAIAEQRTVAVVELE
jgi:hypothetical protein